MKGSSLSSAFREYLVEKQRLGEQAFAQQIEDSLGDVRSFMRSIEQPLDFFSPEIAEILRP